MRGLRVQLELAGVSVAILVLLVFLSLLIFLLLFARSLGGLGLLVNGLTMPLKARMFRRVFPRVQWLIRILTVIVPLLLLVLLLFSALFPFSRLLSFHRRSLSLVLLGFLSLFRSRLNFRLFLWSLLCWRFLILLFLRCRF